MGNHPKKLRQQIPTRYLGGLPKILRRLSQQRQFSHLMLEPFAFCGLVGTSNQQVASQGHAAERRERFCNECSKILRRSAARLCNGAKKHSNPYISTSRSSGGAGSRSAINFRLSCFTSVEPQRENSKCKVFRALHWIKEDNANRNACLEQRRRCGSNHAGKTESKAEKHRKIDKQESNTKQSESRMLYVHCFGMFRSFATVRHQHLCNIGTAL